MSKEKTTLEDTKVHETEGGTTQERGEATGAPSAPGGTRFTGKEKVALVMFGLAWLAFFAWSFSGSTETPETTSSSAPAGAQASTPGVDEIFDDILVHDVVRGLLLLEDQPNAGLKVTAEQREKLRRFWPDIKTVLETNAMRPGPLDVPVRAIITTPQKLAIRQFGGEGRLAPPAHLKVYIEPFERLLAGAVAASPSSSTSVGGPSPAAMPSADASPSSSTSPVLTAASPAMSPAPSPAASVEVSPTPIVAIETAIPGDNASQVAGDPGQNGPADAFEDLYLHDLIAATLVFELEGPDNLRLTQGQRAKLKALWPEMRRKLEANDTRPGAMDDKVRKILLSPQMLAARALIAKGKVSLPPHIKIYVTPFEMLLDGKKPVAVNAAAAPPSSSPVKPAATPRRPSEHFRDIFLHDMIGALILFERDGPASLRLSSGQRQKILVIWPEIKSKLDANSWKPSDVDAKLRDLLTVEQKNAVRMTTRNHKLSLPSSLKLYVEPFGKMLTSKS